VAKIGTSNPDRTISLKRLQCVVENKHKHVALNFHSLLFVTCVITYWPSSPSRVLSKSCGYNSSLVGLLATATTKWRNWRCGRISIEFRIEGIP
jgi:hypothetical protein